MAFCVYALCSSVLCLSYCTRPRRFKGCNQARVYAIIVSLTFVVLLPVTYRDTSPWYIQESDTTKSSTTLKASATEPSFSKPSNNFKASRAQPTSAGPSNGLKASTADPSFAEPSNSLKSSTTKPSSVKTPTEVSVPVKPGTTTSSSTKRNLVAPAPAATTNNSSLVTTTNATSMLGWKVKNACGFPLRVLYFVHTSPSHFHRRRVLRDTIGNPAVSTFLNSSIVFFVGKTSNADLNEEVHAEAQCEGDVVELDHVDTYRNLTLKFVGATKWLAANRCLSSSTDVVVKLDDDVIVNVFLLASYVDRHMAAADVRNSRSIHCATMLYLKPIRNKRYKWFVTKKEYANDTYPPYCCGAAYLMRASVLAQLGEATDSVPFFWVDDVYATGLLTKEANVTLVDIRPMCNISPSYKTAAVGKNTLFFHWGQTPVLFKRSYRYWASVLRQNKTM